MPRGAKQKRLLPLKTRKITVEMPELLYLDIEGLTLEGLHGANVEQTAAIMLAEAFENRYLRPSKELR